MPVTWVDWHTLYNVKVYSKLTLNSNCLFYWIYFSNFSWTVVTQMEDYFNYDRSFKLLTDGYFGITMFTGKIYVLTINDKWIIVDVKHKLNQDVTIRSIFLIIIRLFEKWDVLCYSAVCPSVCLWTNSCQNNNSTSCVSRFALFCQCIAHDLRMTPIEIHSWVKGQGHRYLILENLVWMIT